VDFISDFADRFPRRRVCEAEALFLARLGFSAARVEE
jgi:hypothetical protein